ncbi:MAG: hypothetical protein UV05_C0011G0027 [candidate division CPR1 bacterium GW2011_GWA2_42_17]|uniref:Uncharacterized protein n=1 Tax=candidate division CPR1 bacterium GW2011_GWA2_42_17 TaxID=1618341 RepID=A0A0G1BCR2_9BACT|nr:MAG: hypothetical protein UV05_C0011G0027 [candidate division CPR1 bacterium GW2011_GWA2_42_17]
MAEKKQGIFGKIVGEVTAKGLSWILGPVIGISIGLGIGFVVIDGIINSIREKLGETFAPLREAIPEFHLLDWYFSVLRSVVLDTLGKMINALWLPVLVILILWLAWRFMNWAPKEGELKIYQRMMSALFHGVHAGAKRGGDLTVRGAKRGVEELRRKHAEDVARKQAAMLAALDEENFPIEEGGLDGLEAFDIEPSAFPPPPEFLDEPLSPGKVLKVNLPRGKVLTFNLPKWGG